MFSYLYVINKNESYLLKYRFEYDKKLIDTSYFTMNILPKFNSAEFERGDEYFLEETKSECELKQKNMKKLSESRLIIVYGKQIKNLLIKNLRLKINL